MIQKGSKVSFVKTTTYGSGFRCSVREGTLLQWDERICLIKSKNGKQIFVRSDSVRPIDRRNALAEALIGKEETKE